MLKQAVTLLAAAGVAGCAMTPSRYLYKTSEGCGVAQYGQKWVEGNVTGMSWTGACENRVASGTGVLDVKLASGKTERYEGRMIDGRFHTLAGETALYVEDSLESRGSFDGLYSGKFQRGQVSRAGKLLFDGVTAGGSWSWVSGKVYLADGTYLDGTYLVDASSFDSRGKGVKRARYCKADGTPVHWIEAGKIYPTEASWQAATTANDEAARLLQAKRDALSAQIETAFNRLDAARVQTYGSAEENLAYYAEGRDIQTAKLDMLDKMIGKCSSNENCVFGDLLRSKRASEYSSYQSQVSGIESAKASIESAASTAAMIASMENVLAASGADMTAYNQEKQKRADLENMINRLVGAKKSPAEYATYLAEIYRLVDQ